MSVTGTTETLATATQATAAGSSAATAGLGQSDFLTLMMAQMKAQDPMKPMDSSEFLSQLAQFSTVSGIETLNKSFAAFSDSMKSTQTLQASQLVGRSVVVPGQAAALTPGTGFDASVDLPVMVPDLSVEIYSPTGELVRSMSLQGQGPGLVDFRWDGLDDSGAALPAGTYRFQATGTLDGETQAFETFVTARVASVAVSSEGGQPQLALDGRDAVTLDQVREIR